MNTFLSILTKKGADLFKPLKTGLIFSVIFMFFSVNLFGWESFSNSSIEIGSGTTPTFWKFGERVDTDASSGTYSLHFDSSSGDGTGNWCAIQEMVSSSWFEVSYMIKAEGFDGDDSFSINTWTKEDGSVERSIGFGGVSANTGGWIKKSGIVKGSGDDEIRPDISHNLTGAAEVWIDDVQIRPKGQNPTHILLRSKPYRLYADGANEVTLTADIFEQLYTNDLGGTAMTNYWHCTDDNTTQVTFNLDGPGELLSTTVTVTNGRAQVTYRVGTEQGVAKITATSPGLTRGFAPIINDLMQSSDLDFFPIGLFIVNKDGNSSYYTNVLHHADMLNADTLFVKHAEMEGVLLDQTDQWHRPLRLSLDDYHQDWSKYFGYAERHGYSGYDGVPYHYGENGAWMDWGSSMTQMSNAVEATGGVQHSTVDQYDTFWSYTVGEEPGKDYDEYAFCQAMVRSYDPDALGLTPTTGVDIFVNTEEYRNPLVGLDDYYPFPADTSEGEFGTNGQKWDKWINGTNMVLTFWESYNLKAEWSRNWGKKYWAVLQSFWSGPDADPGVVERRRPLPAETRVQAYMALEAGANGIIWFLLTDIANHPEDLKGLISDQFTNRRDIWYTVSNVNAGLARTTNVFNHGTYNSGNDADPGARDIDYGTALHRTVTGTGSFVPETAEWHYGGQYYTLLVNTNTLASNEATVSGFTAGYDLIRDAFYLDTYLTNSSGEITVNLPPGDAVLLVEGNYTVLTASDPTNNETNKSPAQTVRLTFSEEVRGQTISNGNSVIVSNKTDGSVANGTWEKINAKTYDFTPDTPYGNLQEITVTIKNSAEDKWHTGIIATNISFITGSSTPPVADAGDDITVNDKDDDGFAAINFDGAGSVGVDASINEYKWSTNGVQIASGTTPTVNFPVGSNITVTLFVKDTKGMTDTDTLNVQVYGNLLKNPSFESNRNHWDGPKGNDGDVTTSIDTANAHNGGQSLKITGSTNNGDAYFDQRLSLEPDTEYRCSFWTKSESATNETVTVRFIELDPSTVIYSSTTKAPEGTSDWRKHEFTFTTSAAMTGEGRFDILFGGLRGGAVWVDSLYLAPSANPFPMAYTGKNISAIDTGSDGNETVTLDGTDSFNGTSSITNWKWSTNGNEFATGTATDFNFPRGTNTVTLTVVDNNGRTDTDTMTVTVSLASATANAGTNVTIYDVSADGNETVTLDGSGSSSAAGTLTNYAWSHNGTNIASGTNATANVTLPVGTSTVTLTVYDDGGTDSTDTVEITILTPTAPTADAGIDLTVYDSNSSSDEPVTLNGSGSTKGTGDITNYTWSTNDGSSDIKVATGTNQTVTLPIGTNTIALTIYDNLGMSDTDTLTVIVTDTVPPTADAGTNITKLDSDISGDEEITLNGTDSTGGDGTITNYTWSMNDVVFATNAETNVTFPVGSNTVTLKVYTDNGLWDEDTLTVVVETVDLDPPTADAGTNITVRDTDNNGTESVTLDGSGSTNGTGDITNYTWSTNDGSSDIEVETGTNQTVTLPVGTHTVTLTAYDEYGLEGSDTITVTVSAPIAPTADAGTATNLWDVSDDGTETVTLDGSGSTAGDAAITNYSWTTNNGSGDVVVATGITNSISLPVGTSSITLTVTDSNGLTDMATVAYTISSFPKPGIVSVSPADGTSNIALSASVTVLFNQDVIAAAITNGNGISVTVEDTGAFVSGTWDAEGSTNFVFTPDANFSGYTTYNVTVTTSVTNSFGQAVTNAGSYSFRTAIAPADEDDVISSIDPSYVFVNDGARTLTVDYDIKDLEKLEKVNVNIFNRSGYLIRTLDEQGTEIDRYTRSATWDGKDEKGNTVVGIFFIAIQVDSQDVTGNAMKKIVVIQYD